jgi:cullin 3
VVLEKAIIIFRFLSNKDLFETYYRRHLARRLLQQRSVSDDAERGLLAKLKIESGASFVRDLEGMIKDMKLSSETTAAYKEHLRSSDHVRPLAREAVDAD